MIDFYDFIGKLQRLIQTPIIRTNKEVSKKVYFLIVFFGELVWQSENNAEYIKTNNDQIHRCLETIYVLNRNYPVELNRLGLENDLNYIKGIFEDVIKDNKQSRLNVLFANKNTEDDKNV